MLFLHADCRIADNALVRVADAVKRGHPWGRFDVAIEGGSMLLPAISKLMNVRSRLTGVATGDQAMFVSRTAFATVGGFPALPLMEDIALSSALLRAAGRPVCLRERVVVSGRRWDTHGAWHTIFSMWRLRFDYWRGVDPAALAHRYRPSIGRRAPILQIFAKVPEPGRVKTRLASGIGHTAAAKLYRDLVERTLTTAVSARETGAVSEIEVWCDPDPSHAAFEDWKRRYGVTLRSQRGPDLGTRMHHALASVLAEEQAALLIGTDCPAMDATYLARAAEALKTHDVVVGPAEDGGYVLIGLSRDVDIFSDVPWSTSDVMAITRIKIAAAGATLRELPRLWDLDTPADFARFSSLHTRPMRRAFPWRRPPARSRLHARRS
jgi:rSAM/selenodomain-associated transferase 1